MPLPTVTPIRRIHGPELRAARQLAGLQQAQVADAIGISRSFYHRLETEDRSTSNPATIATLAALLEVPAKQITKPAVLPPQQQDAAA